MSDDYDPSSDPDLTDFLAYVRALIMPTIVIKAFVMFFGLNYSMYPGEGYGYGLALALFASVANISYFIYSQSRKKRPKG
jgi:hypothetical protein